MENLLNDDEEINKLFSEAKSYDDVFAEIKHKLALANLTEMQAFHACAKKFGINLGHTWWWSIATGQELGRPNINEKEKSFLEKKANQHKDLKDSSQKKREPVVTKEEKTLAERLEKCCDRFGKECEETLSKSATVLLEMGELYLGYATKYQGIEQKLCFIKAAGLITAAKVRYQNKQCKERDNLQRAKTLLSKLQRELIVAASDAVHETADTDFAYFVDQTKEKLQSDRELAKTQLSYIVSIEDDDAKQELQKIQQIRVICEKNNEIYIELMRNVAKKCQSVLGEPPCKFAIIGLGSLSRREVTLYSDFEHAILLEDGIQENPSYSSVKEYFRWFTVLFHIIVIRLGETIIPSLDIKSLHSLGTSKSWFYDEYTSCGVSFDGMMTQACKIPLGIPRKTKHGIYTVELIQPVGEMVKFLGKEESLKDGYFLNEVLSRSCLVWGDHIVYEDFVTRCHNIIDAEDMEASISRQKRCILENPNEDVCPNLLQPIPNQKTNKASFYRPVVTIIAYLSRLYRIHSTSTFDILDDMKTLQAIDDETHHILSYTVAIAIEGNLKIYQKTGQQGNELTPQEWSKIVGERSWIVGNVAVGLLQDIVRILPPTCQYFVFPSRKSLYWKAHTSHILNRLEKFSDAIKLSLASVCSILKEYCKSGHAADVLHYSLVLHPTLDTLRSSYHRIAFRCHQAGSELSESHIEKWEWCSQKMLQTSVSKTPTEAVNLARYNICRSQKSYKKALEYFDTNNQNILHWIGGLETRFHAERTEKFLTYLEEALKKEERFKRRWALRIFRCKSWGEIGKKRKIGGEISRVMEEIINYAKQIPKHEYEAFMKMVSEVQRDNCLFDQYMVALRELSAHGISSHSSVAAFSNEKLKRDQNTRQLQKLIICNKHMAIKFLEGLDYLHPGGQYTLATLQANVLSVSFSYKEMMKSMNTFLNVFTRALNHEIVRKHPMAQLPYVQALMVLCENVRERHVNMAIKIYSKGSKKVKYSRILQPFIYGFITDMKDNRNVKNIVQEHQTILVALFGRASCDGLWKLYKQAVYFFSTLQNRSCVRLLWKLLQSPQGNPQIRSASTELLMTATLTLMIVQKRKFPPKYFSKTSEISKKQYSLCLFLDRIHALVVWYALWYMYSDDPLVPIYNLAIECDDIDHRKMYGLLWKILHAPFGGTEIKLISWVKICYEVDVQLRESELGKDRWRKPVSSWYNHH